MKILKRMGINVWILGQHLELIRKVLTQYIN